MIENADRYLDAFVDAGADWVSVHMEAVPHLERAISHLAKRGAQSGVVLNPATPLTTLEEILPEVHHVLLMSVNPGFGGQTFIPSTLDKVRRLKAMIEARRLSALIEIDGGIHPGNVREVVAAGAEIVVAGSAVFGEPDVEGAARRMIEACR